MAPNDSLLVTLLVVVAIVLLAPIFAMMLMMPMMGMWGGWHVADGAAGGGGAGWALVMTWVVALLVILGVGYLLFRAIRRSRIRADPALEELRVAYARGDLSDEEFEARRERLDRET